MSSEVETRFISLMSELFQLSEAEELDFGIYRLIKRHNTKVREFLGNIGYVEGKATLQGGVLSVIFDQAFKQIEFPLVDEQKIALGKLAEKLGIKPGYTATQIETQLSTLENTGLKPDVDLYRTTRLQLLETHSADADRTEVLNRLLEFYDRHYQGGDFIVQRRYGKDGARYVKSTGEDIEFRWATEDMYYIKSGDIFTDYPVRLSNGKILTFAVDPETLNKTRADLKPNDRASYILKGVGIEEQTVKTTLEYAKGGQTKTKLDEIAAATAQKVGVGQEEIARQLRRYIARNQSDFFIHKRLKEALDEDLDIFLKVEVLNADQLLAEGGDQIAARAIRMARVVRQVGRQINAFLGVLEDFQKRIWEKKKLVLDTRYVVTLDRVEQLAGRAFADEVAGLALSNQKQVTEWADLGLGELDSLSKLLSTSDAYLPVPIDTAHFDDEFKWRLLDAVSTTTSLDDAIDGVAIHSDNWQAMNAVERKLADSVKCIYIDPPYNTNASGIPYKNGYRHASWVALMENRVEKLHRLLSNDGAIFVSIDKVERTPLEQLLDRVFGSNNRVEELIWIQNTNDGKSPTYSTNHEYVEVYAKQRAAVEQDRAMFREPKPGYSEVAELVEKLNPSYPSVAEIESALRSLYAQHKADYRDECEALGLDWEVEKRNDSWKGIYPYANAEYRNEIGVFVPEQQAKRKQAKIWVWQESDWTIMSSETKQSETIRNPNHPNFRYYEPLHPITGKPCTLSTRGWKGTQFIDPEYPERNSFESLLNDNRIAFGDDETKVPRQKRMLHEVETNVAKSVFNDYSDGEKQTMAMFGKAGLFLAPKHTNFVSRFILQATNTDSTVVDCFGGSGSTAHAVIEVNRQEKSRRKFVTAEVNKYFNTLIVPRLVKAGASASWQAGKAKSLNGPGLFMRVQRLEQYDETLENLASASGESKDIFAGEHALAYELDADAKCVLTAAKHFSNPFGLEMKRINGADAVYGPVDLVESLIYLLGIHVSRLYREEDSVVITGILNGRNEQVAIFWRGSAEHGDMWLSKKTAEHPAERYFTNDPASLSFAGIEKFESIEQAMIEQMAGSN